MSISKADVISLVTQLENKIWIRIWVFRIDVITEPLSELMNISTGVVYIIA
jgi:hypothetical protein